MCSRCNRLFTTLLASYPAVAHVPLDGSGAWYSAQSKGTINSSRHNFCNICFMFEIIECGQMVGCMGNKNRTKKRHVLKSPIYDTLCEISELSLLLYFTNNICVHLQLNISQSSHSRYLHCPGARSLAVTFRVKVFCVSQSLSTCEDRVYFL